MAEKQVKWIVPDGTDADRRIDAIGGDNFCDRLDIAIANIKAGTAKYWATANGQSVWVVVAQRSNGRVYLKTESDGHEPNNLLALPHRRWAA